MKRQKYKKNRKKRGQEELVGFGLILIMVAIIFIVFISVYIKKPSETLTDYEANSYIQAILQYTTRCQDENMRNLSIQELIRECKDGARCYNYQYSSSCDILTTYIRQITGESWDPGSTHPVKGYSFVINVSENGNSENERQILSVTNNVVTSNYRGAEQDFGDPSGDQTIILFNVYS